ncbi:hypothetical protein BC008_10450 [Mastigocoleus testarum BC008]|uniref:CHAT domain-containing protein n=2 Tax=Mastigocoleus TaxID=996924 RepID=A0A0V7ZEA8_9CYAN|nr:hypothetical protein BC008_10255 [Mastigocoleus testarum BC008]KST62582.1 hypothetical protein BC008_10450 [Mastigocoleus testarum BC008]
MAVSRGEDVKQLKELSLETETYIPPKLNHSRFLAQDSQKPTSEKPSNESGPSKTETRVLISEVVVSGVEGQLNDKIYQIVKTKPGRTTTRSQLELDINAIFDTGFFSNVQAVPEDTPSGVRVTFEVKLNPVLSQVKVQVSPSTVSSVLKLGVVDKIFRPQYGKRLNLQDLRDGIKHLIKWYEEQGYVLANVVDSPIVSKDGVVTLQVAEGVIEDIQVRFVNKDGKDKDKKEEAISSETLTTAILKEIDLKPGSVFNHPQTVKSLQKLLSWGIFEHANYSFISGQDKNKEIVVLKFAENLLTGDAAEILKYQQELQTAQASKNRIAEAQALKKLGYLYRQYKIHYEDGVKKYQTALQIFQSENQEIEVAKVYNNVGNVYYKYDKYDQAISNFQESLKIYQQKKNKLGEAILLNNLGNTYMQTNQYQNAIDNYSRARKIFSYLNEPLWEVITINNLAFNYRYLDEKDKSIELYNQALLQLQNLKQNPVEIERQSQECLERQSSERLEKKAHFFFGLGMSDASGSYIYTGIQLLDDELSNCILDSRFWRVVTFLNATHHYQSFGDYQQALYYSSNALELWKTVENDQEIFTLLRENSHVLKNILNGWLLFQISIIYEELGNKQLSKQYKQQSLNIAEQEIPNFIDLIYSDNRDTTKALLLNIWQIPIKFVTGLQLEEIISQSEKQLIQFVNQYNFEPKLKEQIKQYITLAKHIIDAENLASSKKNSEAIESYNQALGIIQKLKKEDLCLDTLFPTLVFKANKEKAVFKNKKNEVTNNLCFYKSAEIGKAQLLNLVAKNQLYLQQNQEALTSLDLALSRLSITYESTIYKKYDPQEITNIFTKFLSLVQNSNQKSTEEDKQENLGSIVESSQMLIDYFNSTYSANIYGETLSLIAKAHRANQEYEKALEFHNRALKLWQAKEEIFKEADTYLAIATTERERGNLTQARTEIEKAIAMIESERAQAQAQEAKETQDDDFPTIQPKQTEYKSYIDLVKYLESKQNYYDFYIDLLMQQHQQNPSAGYDIEALQASERSHARSLLAMINRDSRNPEGKVQNNSSSNPDYSNPNYIELAKPPQIQKIQQELLDDNTLLLEYSLGEERSYLWAVTKNSITTYELPKRADIEAAAKQFYDFLTVSSLRIRPNKAAASGVKLSQMLLGQVSQQLGNKRLLIVANGILQYIPFSALPIPNSTSLNTVSSSAAVEPLLVEPLLVKHEIVNLPSASTLAVIRRNNEKRQPPSKTLAVLADPIFSRGDERLTRKLNQTDYQSQQKLSTLSNAMGVKSNNNVVVEQLYPRLPNTRKEAEEIASLVPPPEQLQKFDFAANRKAVFAPEFSQYRYIHLATHGILDSQTPERSGVILSLVNEQGEFQRSLLSTPDFFKLNLSADLVTLSGCRTGLGKQVKGEGLIGVTGGLMYSGAKRVMVSLWSVDDRATTELMKRFYQGVLKDKLPPAKALRAAQLAMWREQQWQNPYYWAAFTIQGEWK